MKNKANTTNVFYNNDPNKPGIFFQKENWLTMKRYGAPKEEKKMMTYLGGGRFQSNKFR